MYATYARPEFGYNYQRPAVADAGFTQNTVAYTGGHNHYHTGGTAFTGVTSGTGYTGHTGGLGLTGSTSFTGQTGGLGLTGSTSFTGITGGTGYIGQTGVIGTSGVHRHVYVYTAPQEEEIFQQKVTATGAAQKHYKIIFIKAPSYSTYTQQQLAAQAQSQEKTIIYVLAKKPDEPGDITLPTVAPTPPSKPEVYFIRYKTQKEAVQPGGIVLDGATTSGHTGFDSAVDQGFVATSGAHGHTKYGPPEKIGY